MEFIWSVCFTDILTFFVFLLPQFFSQTLTWEALPWCPATCSRLEALWPGHPGWIMWLLHTVWTFATGAAAILLSSHTDRVDPDLILKVMGKQYVLMYVYLCTYLMYICICNMSVFILANRNLIFGVPVSGWPMAKSVIFIFCIFVFIRTFVNQFKWN